MRIRPILWLALLLAIAASGASPVSAEDAARTGTKAVTRIFKSGNRFVVAVYRADGSAVFGLVEPPKSSPQGKGKEVAAPTLADQQTWRVAYSIDVAAKGAAGKIDVSVGKPGNSKLTRKQRLDLIKQIRSTAALLGVIDKGLVTTEVGATSPGANRTP